MSFLTSLLVICLFIGIAILIIFLVRAKRGSDPGEIVNPMPMWLVAMITSDWHIEPWYSTGGGAKNNWDSSKIDDWSVDAILNCNNGVGTKPGDTPIGVVQSAIKDFVKGIPKSKRLFFYTGDTFSHDLKDTNDTTVAIEKTIMYKVFDKKEGLLKYFEPENIFYAVGNHGAKTDEAFWQKDGVSEAWAQSLVDNRIYTPTGPDDIFWDCGYYKKHLPNSTIDIICFNSILYSIVDGHNGCSNCECQDKQISRLISDLESLPEGRTVYILTHYPIDSDDADKVTYKRFIWDKIGTKYQNVISGIFTGHTHTPLDSLNTWDCNKKPAHTWNVPSIYWRESDDIASYIKVMFPLNEPIVLGQTDVKHVKCENKKTSELEWI